MDIYTVSEARANLYQLVDQVSTNHEPVILKGRRNKVVIISEDDYRAMEETLYLTSIKDMKEALIKGLNTETKDLDSELKW